MRRRAPPETSEPADVTEASGAAGEDEVAVADHSTIGAYLHELRAYPLMTREEEHETAVRFWKNGDPELAARLVTANLRLVVKIAQEHRRQHDNLLDLVQEGNLGLIHAVEKYDPNRGVKLSSYASWWIRAHILNFIRGDWRLVRIGTTQAQRKLFFNLRKEREKQEKQRYRVEARHLAAALRVREQEVIDMERRLSVSEISLDAPTTSDQKGDWTLGDLLPASGDSRPDRRVEATEFASLLKQKLRRFGATLRDRDLEIFRARLLTDDPRKLSDLAEGFGVTRERVRQIESSLKGRLRQYLETELGTGVQPEAPLD